MTRKLLVMVSRNLLVASCSALSASLQQGAYCGLWGGARRGLACSVETLSVETSPRAPLLPQLRLRGGQGQDLQLSGTHRPKCQAYYDVDGTLYDGTMAHCGWWFLWALPDPVQRVSKALQFCFYLPYVGFLASFDEGKAARCLAHVLIRGVSTSDARCASEAVAAGVLRHAFPEVIQHLKQQQQDGHETILLSGNIEPMLTALGSHLRCAVVATTMEQQEVGELYTGKVVGPVCVLEGKRQKLLESINPIHLTHTSSARRTGLVGVGNSVYDVPFLNEVASAWVVCPSSRLRRIAESNGWDMSLAYVRGTGVSFALIDSRQGPERHDENAGWVSKFARRALNCMEAGLVVVYGVTGLGLWMFVSARGGK